MKKVTAADNIMDWAHLVIDGIAYCVSRSKPEIHFEGKEHSDMGLLLWDEKHRWNVASRAAVVHRESGSWSDERPDKWTVHYAGKSISFDHLGRILSGSPKKTSKSGLKVTAAGGFDMENLSREYFNKPMNELNDEDLRQFIKKLKERATTVTPVEPALAPAMTQPPAPAPGASASFSIRWMRTAGENPFAKEDKDEKDESEEKDEKDEKDEGEKKEKPEPKEKAPAKKEKAPSKKESPEEHKEESEDAEEALELLENLLKMEKDEPGAHKELLEKAIDLVKKFLGEEGSEKPMGMPPGAPQGVPALVDLQVEKPMPGPKMGPPMGPKMGPPKPAMSWMQDSLGGFRIGDRVWLKAMVGTVENIGMEPGRVIAVSDTKLVVDWGNEIPTEELPQDLSSAAAADGEDSLFSQPGSENPEMAGEAAPEMETDVKAEIEQILSKTSIQDLLNESPRGSNDKAIVHLGTGLEGEFISKLPDGRICARVAGSELLLWPYEVRFENAAQGE